MADNYWPKSGRELPELRQALLERLATDLAVMYGRPVNWITDICHYYDHGWRGPGPRQPRCAHIHHLYDVLLA